MSSPASLANAHTRDVDRMFPGVYPQARKNHAVDFGYPLDVTFPLAFAAYTRHGIARAGVDKTVAKTWQDFPFVQTFARDDGDDTPETAVEKDIRKRFAALRVWQNMAEADRRSLVGSYSGLILRLADDQPFDAPVNRVPGGLKGLVEVIPAWEGQLEVADRDGDATSENYGHPTMFRFNEAAVGTQTNPRQFNVHPDRVLVWSRDGTVNGRSFLEPGYNALLDMEKISGAGGEGFWKNAKSAPVLQVAADASVDKIAKALGVPADEVLDLMNDQVDDYQRGFHKLLMLQGMEAKTLAVTLPSPEHFFAAPLQMFSASIQMPLKILVGSQTGERASTEDANEWSRTAMSRRTSETAPNILVFIERLEQFGILPEGDWHLDWSDLTEASMSEKVALADKMADVNVKMKDTGEFVFTPDEMRSVAGKEPLTEADKYREPQDDTEEPDALVPPAPEDEA